MAAKARPQLWLVAVPRTAIWFSSLVFEAVPCLVTIVLWFLASKTMDFPYLSQLTGPIFTAFYWNMSDKLFRDFCHITSSRSLEKPRFGWSYWAASECLDESVTLWLFNIAMEAMAHRNRWFFQRHQPPFILGIFHGYAGHNQMVYRNRSSYLAPLVNIQIAGWCWMFIP